MKRWLLILSCILVLGAGGWFINFKQPVSILETLPENVVDSELEQVFIYDMYAVNTVVLTEQQYQQLFLLLSEKNYRKQIFFNLEDQDDHMRLFVTFANKHQSVDFLFDPVKQEVYIYNEQKYHPFSVIHAEELSAFMDKLASKQD